MLHISTLLSYFSSMNSGAMNKGFEILFPNDLYVNSPFVKYSLLDTKSDIFTCMSPDERSDE